MLKLTSDKIMEQILVARKSKGFREVLNQNINQQRREKVNDKQLDKLRHRLQNKFSGDEPMTIVNTPKDEVKMSEVLAAFMKPYLDTSQSHREQVALFNLGGLAWNLAILSEAERSSLLGERAILDLKDDDTLELINRLIARKHKLFANNMRFIMDIQIKDQGDHFHIAVASTFVDKQN